MQKEELKKQIQEAINTGVLTMEDLKSMTPSVDVNKKVKEGNRLIEILYGIGGAIVIAGVLVLIFLNWDSLNYTSRVLITLGISILTFIGAMLYDKQKKIQEVTFLISAILAPIGVYVAYGKTPFTLLSQIYVGIALAIIFKLAYYTKKSSVSLLASIAFISWSYYVFIVKYIHGLTTIKWATIILGIAYLLIAWWAYMKNMKGTRSILAFIGSGMMLLPAIFLPYPMDFVSIILIFAVIYLSPYLKTKTMSFVGFLVLIVYIIKLTIRYFSSSLGWPISLIIIGFVIIGVTYGAMKFNDRYIVR